MRTIISLLVFNFLFSVSALGQGQTNVWYTGNGAGLDFNTVPPTRLQDGNSGLMTFTGEGVGSMSDANGSLLFYTNGTTVFNRNHVAMTNGTGLNGNGTTVQTGTIVPMIGNANQYYLISPLESDGATKYSVVDMTLGSGLGDVVVASKNTTLMANASEACLTIPHSNGTDFWVLLHASLAATYHVFLFTSSGVTGPTNYTVGSIPQATMLMKVNSCYTQIATVLYNKTKVEVVSFNNTTGVVSGTGIKTITNFFNPECYGAEFSPNGRFLYVTEAGLNSRKTVHQFDLNAGNDAAINASRRYYTADATITRMGHLQMGPDAKIYVPGYTTVAPSYMSVIPNPDVQWTSPNPTSSEFQYLQYTFNATRVGEGLPAVIRKLVTSIHIVSSNACEGGSTSLSYVFGSLASGATGSISWNFGDGSTATDIASPTHIYTTAGTYTVTATIIDTCGQSRTSSASVTIRPGPQVTVPMACPNTNVILTGTGAAASTYTWSLNSNMSPLLATGSTYTYNGALPVTIYVHDPTPLSTSTVGNPLIPPAGNAGADVGYTYFETYQTLSITSFQIYSRASGSANLSLQNEAGTTTYWGPTACNPTAASQTFNFTPNVSLAAGRYRLYTSLKTPFWRENTSADGGRDINNVIDVLGEKNGTKGGSFLNIVIALPDPCETRATPILDSCVFVLPVELISFHATPDENIVKLDWTTASETNNDYFIVQKSKDGKEFIGITQIDGAGNTSKTHHYTFTDTNPYKGKSYYRLAQIDYDGAIKYSHMEEVNFKITEPDIRIYPNPAQNNFTIRIDDDNNYNLEIISADGQLKTRQNEISKKVEIDCTSFVEGIFLLKITSEDKNYFRRIAVTR